MEILYENCVEFWIMKREVRMNKRGAGVIFCLIAGLLFTARYFVAAIFMSGVASWDSELFAAGLEYQGNGLIICSIISLAAGVLYLVLSEIEGKSK